MNYRAIDENLPLCKGRCRQNMYNQLKNVVVPLLTGEHGKTSETPPIDLTEIFNHNTSGGLRWGIGFAKGLAEKLQCGFTVVDTDIIAQTDFPPGYESLWAYFSDKSDVSEAKFSNLGRYKDRCASASAKIMNLDPSPFDKAYQLLSLDQKFISDGVIVGYFLERISHSQDEAWKNIESHKSAGNHERIMTAIRKIDQL